MFGTLLKLTYKHFTNIILNLFNMKQNFVQNKYERKNVI